LSDVNSRDYPPEIIAHMLQYYAPERIPETSAMMVTQLVAVAQNKVLGVGGWRWAEKEPMIAYIGGMFVEPAMHKHGVGRSILTELETDAKHHGAKKLLLRASLTAVGFYERLNFRKIQWIDQPLFGEVWEMEKSC
jgi:GNAT superfamily N-acetyltransferase